MRGLVGATACCCAAALKLKDAKQSSDLLVRQKVFPSSFIELQVVSERNYQKIVASPNGFFFVGNSLTTEGCAVMVVAIVCLFLVYAVYSPGPELCAFLGVMACLLCNF